MTAYHYSQEPSEAARFACFNCRHRRGFSIVRLHVTVLNKTGSPIYSERELSFGVWSSVRTNDRRRRVGFSVRLLSKGIFGPGLTDLPAKLPNQHTIMMRAGRKRQRRRVPQ